jgi:hypothetical protein
LHNKVSEETNSEGFSAHRTQAVDHRLTQLAALSARLCEVLVPILAIARAQAELGVPVDLGGCHTSKVEGYIVEGHVPVAAVERLLNERPAILGLSVPGMPLGSPGMEIEGEPAEPYEVIAFSADGSRYVFR